MQKGFIAPLILAVLFVGAAVAGTYLYSSHSESIPGPSPSASASPSASVSASVSPTPAVSTSPQAVDPRSAMEFTMAGYMNAVKTDKLVVLFFYANWCPICRDAFPEFQKALVTIGGGRVVAFRVNYNDSETTAEEKTAAETFQVGSQHTIVIVKHGEMAATTDVSGWNDARFKAAIEEHLR